MENRIIFITKDVLRADDLPIYGNRFWKTPNISELASKGTVFRRHYTAAPSTGMAITCMFSGLEAYQLERKIFGEVEQFNQSPTIFNQLSEAGYACHVILDESYFNLIYRPSKVFSEATIFHKLRIAQNVGPHRFSGKRLVTEKRLDPLYVVLEEIDAIKDQKCFIWFHAPHVFAKHKGYGSDIDYFDKIIGGIRKRFEDRAIIISSDHGHMRCEKNIPVYGFHVYEGNIRIPLITPRIANQEEITFPTSNVQIKDIILNNSIEKRAYVYSDTQYYAQPNRKLAIIKDRFKYIYNKWNGKEEFYDLDWDPTEQVNLLVLEIYDKDRHTKYFLSEVYYYPYWDEVCQVSEELRACKDRIWRRGSIFEEKYYRLKGIAIKFLCYWK